MQLHYPSEPLRHESRPIPVPGGQQVLLRAAARAVCRTDLHVLDSELPNIRLPIIPGHEVVGTATLTLDR